MVKREGMDNGEEEGKWTMVKREGMDNGEEEEGMKVNTHFLTMVTHKDIIVSSCHDKYY